MQHPTANRKQKTRFAPLPPRRLRTALYGTLLAAGLAHGAEPTATELGTVLVTATRTEVESRDVPAAFTVVTREQLQATPAADLLEAVREATGISLTGRGVGNRRTIDIRGLEGQHTLILVNGRRVSASDDVVGHSDFENNWVPLEAIERIEIVRGPLSSLYGSEGMGGVINIITRQGTDQWQGSVSATTGVRDDDRGGRENSVGLYASGPLSDSLALTVSGELLDHEKTSDKADPAISEAEGKELGAAAVTLTYRPSDAHAVELYHGRIDEERPRDTRSRTGVLHESTYKLDRRMTSLEHRGRFGATNTVVRLYESSLDVDNRTTNGVAPATPQKLTDRVLEGFATFPAGERHLITAGAEQREERLDHIALADGSDSADNRALYVQDEIELREGLLLTLGTRVDDQEFFGSEASPRAYLVYHLSQRVTLKGGYGEGFRAPTLKQLSPDYRFVGFHTFVGNPDLKPETSRTGELAVEYHGERVRTGLTVFRNDVEDLIDTQCIVNCGMPFGQEFEYINVAEARIDGAELELAAPLPGGFDLGLSLTALDTEDRTSGEPLEGRPELSTNLRLGWRSTGGRFSAALRAQYVGEQAVFSSTGVRSDLPAYTLWHLSVRQRLTRQLTLRAGVENLTDVYLAEKHPDFAYEERGRFFYTGVEASF